MNSISFTNPYLLFVGIALLAVVLVPFFLSIKKIGFNFHNITSLVIHGVLAVLVTLALAGMTLTLVMTETDVYVLADCSYSSIKNLDTVDTYIKDLNENLPDNSKLGIICYGKDYEVLTNLGEKIKSVSENNIDDTQTNIRPALEYTTTLFNDDAIKRIVIISDGGETNQKSISGLISDYEERNIHIDAIFLDNNLKEDADEFQISDVSYNPKTYIGKDENVTITVDSNKKVMTANLNLYHNNEVVSNQTVRLEKGSNQFKINLDTSVAGTQSFRAEISEYTDDEHRDKTDTNPYNNVYYFDQDVTDEISILYLSNSTDNGSAEYNTFKAIYGDESKYKVTKFINDDTNIPVTLTDLAKYDEIVLNNFNVNSENFKQNSDMFVNNLSTIVSEYGKSVVTIGNTYVQGSTGDDAYKTLSTMLPVNFDKDANQNRSYIILLDISKSMFQAGHILAAKQVAYNLLDLLTEKDQFTVIPFYGDNMELFSGKATKKNIDYVKEEIKNLTGRQATNISAALNVAYNKLVNANYKTKQVMLISDGRSFSQDETSIKEAISKMKWANINVDWVCVNEEYHDAEIPGFSTLKSSIESNENNIIGKFTRITREEDASSAVFSEIADKVTNIHRDEGNYAVNVAIKDHEVLTNVSGISKKIKDFYAGVEKTSANTILETVDKKVNYPLYATWNFGDGKVTSLATSLNNVLSGEGSNENIFLSNIVTSSTPNNQNYSSYKVTCEKNGDQMRITVIPQTVNPNANVVLSVIDPSGNTTEYKMNISSNNYYYDYNINLIGSYKLVAKYNDVEIIERFNFSYYSEYDSFTSYDSAYLYNLITSDGQVSEDGKLIVSNDNLPITTYTYEFTPLFMIISCALFVCDIAIRKLRWQDIKDIFTRKKKVN